MKGRVLYNPLVKENRPVLNSELHKKVIFLNQYVGDGANYCNDLEFDVEGIEKALERIRARGILVVAPLVYRDGTHVKKQKLYKIEDSNGLNRVRILINGRKIVQEEFDKGVDPKKMGIFFADQFNNVFREAVVEHADHIGLIPGMMARTLLELRPPQFVKLKKELAKSG